MLYENKQYLLPRMGENDYGINWPKGTDQITKELVFFGGNPPEGASGEEKYRHGLRLVRMIWSNDAVALYRIVKDKEGNDVVIWNNYFMDIFKALCENQRVCLSGCASSGKTFAVAVYCLLMFYADPTNLTCMVSTTAGTDAERRIWGEIKLMHQEAQKTVQIGTLIEYLKTITIDPKKELEKSKTDIESRDLGSGIMVIPIPDGKEGDKALGKIIGTKNKRVIWVLDEMPHMQDDVLRPESNLEGNAYYQFIGIGNANRKTDAHGKLAEPRGGWESVHPETSQEWDARTDCKVLFLHGERSPNMHPAVEHITDKFKLPFQYLSNRIFLRSLALRNGIGATEEEMIESGKKTIDYWRFGVGYWYGADVDNTVLSSKYVSEHKANMNIMVHGPKPLRKIGALDPSFTSGGDANSLCIGAFGEDYDGNVILDCPKDTIHIVGEAESRESFRKNCAIKVVDECIRNGVKYGDLFIDISGDGGMMALEIQEEWSNRTGLKGKALQGISSLEKTGDETDRYHDIVTKLWFQVQRAIATGRVRNFNVFSRYAKDLFERQYESTGRGVIRIEPKGNLTTYGGKGFRSRMGRSPDDGDAFVYMLEGAKRRGFSLTKNPLPEQRPLPDRSLGRFFPTSRQTQPAGFQTVDLNDFASSDVSIF